MGSMTSTVSVFPGLGFWSVGPSANDVVNRRFWTPAAVGVRSVRPTSTPAPPRSWPKSQEIVRAATE